jgi:GH24 family phage-related lysozyme (muramidase)
MSTWVKETATAIYLMEGGHWISRLTKQPSKTNPDEQVLNIAALRSWFMRDDYPRAMVIDTKPGPEPTKKPGEPKPAKKLTELGGTGLRHPVTGLTTNEAGLELMKHFEGLELEAYICPAGVWTIGYGHTSAAGPPTVYPGMKITQSEATAIFQRDLRKFEQGVRDCVKVPLTSNEFSALVSFALNCGVGALRMSTLLRKLNSSDYQGAADEFLRWTKGGGRELPGLVRRRKAERELFLKR